VELKWFTKLCCRLPHSICLQAKQVKYRLATIIAICFLLVDYLFWNLSWLQLIELDCRYDCVTASLSKVLRLINLVISIISS